MADMSKLKCAVLTPPCGCLLRPPCVCQVMHAEAPARFRESIPQDKRALVDGRRPPPQIRSRDSSI